MAVSARASWCSPPVALLSPQSSRCRRCRSNRSILRSARNVAKLIEELHYSLPRLDNSLSSAILDQYLDTLDGNRMYFTAGDIASFNRLRYELDDRDAHGRPAARVRHLQSVPQARRRARRRRDRAARHGARLHARRNVRNGIAASCRGRLPMPRSTRSGARTSRATGCVSCSRARPGPRPPKPSRNATSAHTSASLSSRPTTSSRRT